VFTNAAGGINLSYRQGGLVLISDHINLQGSHPLIGPNNDAEGPRFPDMSEAYSPAYRALAHQVAHQLKVQLEEGVYAAFAIHRWIATNIMVPALPLLDPIVYLSELSLGVAFMLGFVVRPMAVVGILFTLQLWLGLYQHPHEWPWQYFFLMFTMGFFFVTRAGMSLGLDGLLARKLPSSNDGMWMKLYRRFA